MSYRAVDTLSADQIEVGDLIGFDGGEPILVMSIDILSNGCQINYADEYDDEMLSKTITDDDIVVLYVYDEDD